MDTVQVRTIGVHARLNPDVSVGYTYQAPGCRRTRKPESDGDGHLLDHERLNGAARSAWTDVKTQNVDHLVTTVPGCRYPPWPQWSDAQQSTWASRQR